MNEEAFLNGFADGLEKVGIAGKPAGALLQKTLLGKRGTRAGKVGRKLTAASLKSLRKTLGRGGARVTLAQIRGQEAARQKVGPLRAFTPKGYKAQIRAGMKTRAEQTAREAARGK